MHYIVPDLRIRCYDSKSFNNGDLSRIKMTVHDVIQIPSVYNIESYMSLVTELENANNDRNGKLLVPWHKSNHLVANDKHRGDNWKSCCPTLESIIDDIVIGFNITVNYTRVNIYRSGESGRWGESESKPFHHDRSASTAGLSQNITIGVSLGCEREIAFKHAKRKRDPDDRWHEIRSGTVVSSVCSPGSIYAFARDVNCEFQHGILPPHDQFGSNNDLDRVSIIIWGTSYNMDTNDSRVSKQDMPSSRELGINDRNKKFQSTN